MKMYALETVEGLIQDYVDNHGGQVTTIEEGVLGYGTTLLHSAEGCKTIVIKEVYLNAWSSSHTVRMYNVAPKKYQKFI
jgi:hypothetical protein